MNLITELHAIAGVLAIAKIPYAVCAAVAKTAHGVPRSTVEMLIARADLTVVLDAIRPLGYARPGPPATFDVGTDRERHVQRVSKLVGNDPVFVDLLLAEAAFAGALDDRVEMELPGGPLTIVSRTTLARMKHLTGHVEDDDL